MKGQCAPLATGFDAARACGQADGANHTGATPRAAESGSRPPRGGGGPTLKREVFEISRELEFFSEKELQMQIGHARRRWPEALLKELVDNGLDACESAGIAPEITVEVEPGWFSVTDNGPGIPAETIRRSLDFLKRVSDKVHYISPTRGQLGNALKTVYAAPFVADGKRGLVEIWSQGTHHRVEVALDRLAGRPVIGHVVEEVADVKNGATVRVHWPESASSPDGEEIDESYNGLACPEPRSVIAAFSALNPHATFTLGDDVFLATDPGWRKWWANDPTSAHWYTPEAIRDLIAAHIVHEKNGGRARTVREFVSEFRGLSGSAKQKAATGELSGLYLRDIAADGDVDMNRVTALLRRMQDHSRAPKPQALGVLGKDHLRAWMARYTDVDPDSVRYKKIVSRQEDAMPHVVEAAFGIGDDDDERLIVFGLNFSPAVVGGLPFTLASTMAAMRIDPFDPVTLVVHVARPRFDFTDRGKTGVNL